MKKQFMGMRLRHLREERGLTQAALARGLGISASYLNQIEKNLRPATLRVLMKFNAMLGVDLQPSGDEAHLLADLRAAMADEDIDAPSPELRELALNMPGIARAVIAMQKRLRDTTERANILAGRLDSPMGTSPAAFEEVRDYFYARNNHIAELDAKAERLASELTPLPQALPQRLADRHGVSLRNGLGPRRSFDADQRVLTLSPKLHPGQRLFQMATQLAFLEMDATIDAMANEAAISAEAQGLLRVGLANYFAGALLLPYGTFLHAAEMVAYDIDLLSAQFGMGFEAICHRLSTLQREDVKGVPFFFIRVDRAGNISKRQSATDFHFSRIGGSCPLWNVYDAFSRPGEILTQLARMPDGRSYLWVARMVTSRQGGHGTPAKTFAVALGCDSRHATRLVYAKGLDLRDPDAATPIGAGCKICERPACPQRAFPMTGRAPHGIV